MRILSKVVTLVTLLTMVFLYAPILTMIAFSFSESKFGTDFQRLSLKWYHVAVSDKSMLDGVRNSVTVASAATLLSLIIGISSALMARDLRRKKERLFINMIAYSPLFMPDIVLGITIATLFFTLKLPFGILTIILAHSVFGIPIAFLIGQANLARLDPRLELAAMDCGANRFQVVRTITLPLLVPALLGSAATIFVLSFGDFTISFFTSGPGATTLPVKIYSAVKFNISPAVNAIFSLTFLLITISVVILVTTQSKMILRRKRS